SWLAPRDAIRQGDWGRITDLARATLDHKEGRAL
ncbi:keto-deoxy-phosphogluconate aldolase, partial [Microvirga sp. KLBC 81]